MKMSKEIKQWPDAICTGKIRYGKAELYDGFYLADAEHGIPTIGSVRDKDAQTILVQRAHVFNYPGQTEAIAKQLVHRWNCHNELVEALTDLLELTDDLENDADPEESTFAFARAAIAKARGE